MDNQSIAEEQRMVAEHLGNHRPVPIIHTEPDALKQEAIQRLKHYSAQEEKLTFELSRIRQMIDACQSMLSSFDKHEKMDSAVPSREY